MHPWTNPISFIPFTICIFVSAMGPLLLLLTDFRWHYIPFLLAYGCYIRDRVELLLVHHGGGSSFAPFYTALRKLLECRWCFGTFVCAAVIMGWRGELPNLYGIAPSLHPLSRLMLCIANDRCMALVTQRHAAAENFIITAELSGTENRQWPSTGRPLERQD